MKKANYLLLLIALVALFAASCGKTGAVGPQGPQGPVGPIGPQGLAGLNGTMIYSGGTVPDASTGANGDFYIDLATEVLYGPKTAAGWGTGIALVGPQGKPGTNGTIIYSGNTPPPATTGVIGDFYIDLTTGIFYGPKTADGWGTGFSLKGSALGVNFPTVINTVLTPGILDTLKSHGSVINDGLTPPSLNGIYLVDPNYCTFDNSGDNRAYSLFDSYKYQFYNQNNATYAIQVNYKDINGGDAGSDVSSTYISGSGTLFTIYAQTTGIEDGINYTSLQIISGQIGALGVTNFQLSDYLVSKGDDSSGVLEPVGSTRIFTDEDGLSDTQTTFSIKAKQVQTVGQGKSLWSAKRVHKIN